MEENIDPFLPVAGNCRNQLYFEGEIRRKIDRKKICGYLKKLEKNGDDYKIKHIKKMYKIYNIFYQIKSLIYSKDTFEYTDKDLSINDFYGFLNLVIECIKDDIIKFIDILQDDDFNNDEPLLKNLDENQKKFNIYLKFNYFM